MAGFNKELDKALFTKSVDVGDNKLTVAVMSYNGKEGKLQISREKLDARTGAMMFMKLGRVTKAELVAILPLIQEAEKVM
jgi:hypothetical protein